jgi:hypothetical protein
MNEAKIKIGQTNVPNDECFVCNTVSLIIKNKNSGIEAKIFNLLKIKKYPNRPQTLFLKEPLKNSKSIQDPY